MVHRYSNLVAFRVCVLTLCLAFLAGCNVPQPPAYSSVAAPTNLMAAAGDARVILTWTASNGATGYNIKRATVNGGPYALIGISASTTYTDSSAANGTTYYYVVSALDADGEGQDSAQTSATPIAPTAPPTAPSNVVAIAGDSEVNLTWTINPGANSYRVKRATVTGGPYAQIASPTSPSYHDTSVTNGTTYYYVISAINSLGESTNSIEVTAVPSPPPPTTFGTWTDVTPAGADLTTELCSNYGAKTVQADPGNQGHLYTAFDCQGIWKSTDYGITWIGPINTGTNGALAGACSGGIAISPSSTANVPTIYQACIRGAGVGFWKSVDGGVNWTRYTVAPGGLRQDYFPPAIDPYDENHLLMAGHEFDSLVESVDGGLTWTSVSLDSAMLQGASNSTIFFVNTGSASTTRGTWLWTGAPSGGAYGTWRTVNGGASWVQVNKNENTAQIYQPDNGGVIYLAGSYSASGSGVLRSTNYGQTWTHVGLNKEESIVFGTTKIVYSMFGYAAGPGASVDPALQVGSQPGGGTWVAPGTPPSLLQGPAQVAVVNDGTHSILVGAMFNSGVWRYVEP